MAAITTYKDLEVWQMSIAFAEQCYRITKSFPREEAYGLTSQIRRACVSIPANIAEGWGRDQTGSYIQFLRIAQGSARDVETHLILAHRLGLVAHAANEPLINTCERISKMLRSHIRTLEERSSAP